ncbi:hypothetical protein [Nonomuraea sp. NPDC046570]|uniref:hypothetical protein n=1 Tax=Nonomuraea sp. NPDC046570 TaxID=3155255 RepID=UPI0033D41A3E
MRRARLAERNLAPGVAELYRLLAGEIAREVAEYGGATLVVDGVRGVEETVAEVERIFAGALDEGPVAAERGPLLRYANRAIVEQYQAYFARPWSRGDARTTVVVFACECGRDGCGADVELAVADFPAAPLLAPGH